MESYTTVLHEGTFEYEDRRSVFIGECVPVSSESDALDFIAYMKKKYSDANHHVYAYVLRDNSIMRFSDDREPQGTAGMPVLDAIRKRGCTDAVIVVVRYFGGTLLGTGGLVRAYSAAAVGALESSEIITYDIYTLMQITLSYSEYQKVLPVLSDSGFRTEDTRFTENVIIIGKTKKTDTDTFLKKLGEVTFGRAKAEIIDEKFDF